MVNKINIWSLIKDGRFEEACELADAKFEETGDISHLRNKIYALFHLENYDEIVDLEKRIIKSRNGETDSDFIFLGIAYWLKGEKINAIQTWKSAVNCKYTDAAGGLELQIILYFAGIAIGDDHVKADSVRVIKKKIKSKASINWPGPLGHYVVNEISEVDLFLSIIDIPTLKERQLCQSYFVAAIKKLEISDYESYVESLWKSISYGSQSYLEQFYYLAKGELAKIN